MKKFLSTLLLVASTFGATPPAPVIPRFVSQLPSKFPVTFFWDYATNGLSSNLVFNLYSTTNLTLAMSNWPLVTNITSAGWPTNPVVGSNGVQSNFTVTIFAAPGQAFYTVTASNEWGESDFSNVVETTPLPTTVKLGIRIGP